MAADAFVSKVHLLDVGHEQYGDCVLCEVRGKTILIDGGHPGDLQGSSGHPSIPAQLSSLLRKQNGQIKVSLLVISHAHNDHVGCIPDMIAKGMLGAEWALMVDPNMAWGHSSDDEADAVIKRQTAAPDAMDRLVALLREEPRTDLTDRIAFQAAAADALGLQQRYRNMITKLKKDGTKVVLLGKNSPKDLEDALSDIDFHVLGPSKKHVEVCRDIIQEFGRDFRQDFRPSVQADSDVFDLYNNIQQRIQDAPDKFKGPGPAINLQSSILVFGDGTHRFLFTGDSQLEDLEVSSEVLENSVASILEAIKDHAPYDFVKLGHHGSSNAFGQGILDQIGEETQNFGICTGSESTHHPSSATLKILKAKRNEITWARTDRNGRSTFTFGAGDPTVEVTRRKLNDLTTPGDEPLISSERVVESPEQRREATTSPQPVTPVVMEPIASIQAPVPIEVRIPYLPDIGAQISLHLDIKPHTLERSTFRGAPPDPRPASEGDFRLASGRTLPPLLFVTSERALARNIGGSQADRVLESLKDSGQTVLSTLPDNVTTSKVFHDATTAALKQRNDIRGVVILGGLDVIPSERRDTLPPSLRSKINVSMDQDHFIVWSDALYGDSDGDGLPELPVSRIPDGRSANLVYSALSAPRPTSLNRRDGVRNLMRPFADQIFAKLSGNMPELRCSYPQRYDQPKYSLQGDHVYLMLHGDDRDATLFWGETEEQDTVPAVNIENVAVPAGAIVFSGCCWGALTARQPAIGVATGDPVEPRTPKDSLALRFLECGALAFIGCTGVHYSPLEAPYNYFGGPLHRMFWDRVIGSGNGVSPAQALYEARRDYLAELPARAKSAPAEAIERKLYEEFTCLGLGW